MRSSGAIAEPALWVGLMAAVTSIMSGPALAQSPGTVEGRVVNERGAAVPSARVEIRSLDDGSEDVVLETAADGTYKLRALPPGRYAVTAGTADLASDMFRIRVRPGRRVAVNLTLARGLRDASWLTDLGNREAASRHFAAGLAASKAGDFAAAVVQFTRAVDRWPECAACFYNLAISHVALEQLAQAEAAFNHMLQLTPDYAAAYYGLASVYTKLGRTDDAVAARGEATRLALASLAARRERFETALDQGIATLRAGQPGAARERFETLLAQDSAYPALYFWLGVALRELGEPAPAADAFERYLALEDDGALADDARAALSGLNRK